MQATSEVVRDPPPLARRHLGHAGCIGLAAMSTFRLMVFTRARGPVNVVIEFTSAVGRVGASAKCLVSAQVRGGERFMAKSTWLCVMNLRCTDWSGGDRAVMGASSFFAAPVIPTVWAIIRCNGDKVWYGYCVYIFI